MSDEDPVEGLSAYAAMVPDDLAMRLDGPAPFIGPKPKERKRGEFGIPIGLAALVLLTRV